MTETDYVYFARRGLEEREAADRASHPAARSSHLELAGRYEELADALAPRVLIFNRATAG